MPWRPRRTAEAVAKTEEQIRVLALEGKRQKEICYEVGHSDKHVSEILRFKLGIERVLLTAEERKLIAALRKEAGIQCVI